MKKRLLAAIMSLCMIFSLLPVSALAVPTASGAGGETVEITGTKIHNGWFEDYNCYGHEWSSSDPSVATVINGGEGRGHVGIVTGVARGEVTITHSYKYDVGLSPKVTKIPLRFRSPGQPGVARTCTFSWHSRPIRR